MSAQIIETTLHQPTPAVWDDDNPIITCPVCGFTAPLMNGFSYLAAGFNGIESGSTDDVDLLECGRCSARID